MSEQESKLVFLFLYDSENVPQRLLHEMKEVKGVSCIPINKDRRCFLTNNSRGIVVDKLPSFVVSDGISTEIVESKEEFLDSLSDVCSKCFK